MQSWQTQLSRLLQVQARLSYLSLLSIITFFTIILFFINVINNNYYNYGFNLNGNMLNYLLVFSAVCFYSFSSLRYFALRIISNYSPRGCFSLFLLLFSLQHRIALRRRRRSSFILHFPPFFLCLHTCRAPRATRHAPRATRRSPLYSSSPPSSFHVSLCPCLMFVRSSRPPHRPR